MDEFLDHLFSSSSWSDVNATEKSSQVCSGSAQINGLLPDLMGVYEGNEINSHTNLISSNQIIESLTAQGTSSILVGGSSNYGLGKGLLPSEAQPQPKDTDNESMPFLNAVVNGNPKAGYLGLQLNTTASASTPVTLNLASPKVLPVVGSLVKSPHALPESDSVGSNGDQLSVCQQSLGDSHSLPSIPQLWPPPSYGSVSSLSPVIQKDNLQGFSLQEEFVDSDKNVMGNQNILQVDNLPTSVSKNGQDELHIYHMSSFIAVPPITLSRTAGLQSQLQLSQLSQGNSVKHYMNQAPVSQLQSAPTTSTGGCNGSVKPRVRARRGQATDPHSIAERLRREKISERMKNLQELVPSFNKTNKASMLDEIIEYVKFLQLQVKVLSMSRLGAAGAVVPLITDGQAEGTSGVLLSSSTAHTADPSESLDALEQEVAKLMESNVTTAMQYLQRKGLCLMPISLAAALSGEQPSLDPVLGERKKPNLTHGLVPSNNGSPGVGTRQMYSDGEIVSKDNVMGNHDSKGITTSGAFVRQEEVNNTSCTTGELKP